MAQKFSDFKSSLALKIRDKTNGQVEDNDLENFLQRAVRKLQNMHEFPGTKESAVISVYKGEHVYTTPTGYNNTIDFLLNNSSTDMENRTSQAFWSDVDYSYNIFADDNENEQKLLLINYDTQNPEATINTCNGITDNGTWAAVSGTDATNVQTDEFDYFAGSASISFDIDVSLSGTDTAAIENSTMTQVDLSDHEDKGTVFLRALFPDTSNLTSVTLRWGNDSSNYWEQTVTTQFSGLDFEAGVFNALAFNWYGATEVGTPDAGTVDYVHYQLNYSSSKTDDTGFLIDQIVVKMPKKLVHRYYSYLFVKSSAGEYKENFTEDDDISVLEPKQEEMLMLLALEEAADLLREQADSQKARAEFNQMFAKSRNEAVSERKAKTDSYYYQL